MIFPSSFVLDQSLQLKHQVPGDFQDGARVVPLRHFVEELDDIGEVHVVVEDYVPIILHQGKCNEKDKVTRSYTTSHPNRFPHAEHVFVHQLPFEIEQEPSIAEVEVRVVPVLVH